MEDNVMFITVILVLYPLYDILRRYLHDGGTYLTVVPMSLMVPISIGFVNPGGTCIMMHLYHGGNYIYLS